EYIFGKLTILLAFLLLVTWVPAVVLLLVQIMFSGSLAFFRTHLQLFPAITLFSAIEVLTIAVLMLALSSLSRSSRYVGILYAAFLFFTQAIYLVLFAFPRASRPASFSVLPALRKVVDAIFRLPLPYK